MKITHRFVAFMYPQVHRALDGVRALRADAALARRASARAQLPRRRQAELRALYLSPGPPPDTARSTQAQRAGAVRHREHWFGPRGTTAVVVCALIVVVVAIAAPLAG